MNLQLPDRFSDCLPATPLVFSFKWFRMQWIIRKFLCDLACRVLIRPGQAKPGKSNRNESRPLVPLSKGQIRSTMRAGVAPPPHTHTYQRAPRPAPLHSLCTPLLMPACLAPYKAEPSKRHFKFRGAKNKNKKVGKNFRFSIFFVYTFGWGYIECEGNANMYTIYIYIYNLYILVK